MLRIEKQCKECGNWMIQIYIKGATKREQAQDMRRLEEEHKKVCSIRKEVAANA